MFFYEWDHIVLYHNRPKTEKNIVIPLCFKIVLSIIPNEALFLNQFRLVRYDNYLF